ncbi:serine/threonine-protein kinase [Peterkaempfera sp. SMS 1(5)a]|uniref:serine/threonine-protein kinase n=1 Tax=Peterkaempfera podocarpi TaxID=3232308 RepID=UPI00366BDD5D
MAELADGDPRKVGGYVLLGRLGAGGMGQVYLGRSPGGRTVAVKVIRPELCDDPGFRVRFRREVAAARAVSGGFTAPLVDADTEAERPWLATSYVAGPSLQEAVDHYGPFGGAAWRTLAAGLAEALVAVHAAGLVHRDLKPSNVLLAADGPRVIDFGIARAADATALTGTGHIIGSPGYMSPEQANGHAVGPASDVFSLGAVLAFAASGRGPFGDGPSPAVLYRVAHNEPALDGVPEELRPLLDGLLAKDPQTRPGPAEVLARFTAGGAAEAGAAWLPAPVAADVSDRADRLAALDRAPTVTATVAPAAPRGAEIPPVRLGGAPAAGPGGRSRRRLALVLAGVFVAVATASGAGVWVLQRRDVGGRVGAQGAPPASSHSSGPTGPAASPGQTGSAPASPAASDSASPAAPGTGGGGSVQQWQAGELTPFLGMWNSHAMRLTVEVNGVLELDYRTYRSCPPGAPTSGSGSAACDSTDPVTNVVRLGGHAEGVIKAVKGPTATAIWGSGNPDYPQGGTVVLTYDRANDALSVGDKGLFCGPKAPAGYCGA